MSITGYCPHCGQNVLMKREEMNAALAIFLFCCCCIGFIIYLIVYYTKSKNRCIHCGSLCQVYLPTTSSQTAQQLQYQPQPDTQYVQTVEQKVSFCPLCGSKLGKGVQNFCPNCGGKI